MADGARRGGGEILGYFKNDHGAGGGEVPGVLIGSPFSDEWPNPNPNPNRNPNPNSNLTLTLTPIPTRETLESVSSCTRFSGFLTISSFSFNRLS